MLEPDFFVFFLFFSKKWCPGTENPDFDQIRDIRSSDIRFSDFHDLKQNISGIKSCFPSSVTLAKPSIYIVLKNVGARFFCFFHIFAKKSIGIIRNPVLCQNRDIGCSDTRFSDFVYLGQNISGLKICYPRSETLAEASIYIILKYVGARFFTLFQNFRKQII